MQTAIRLLRVRFVTPSRPADFQSRTDSAKVTDACSLTPQETNRQAAFFPFAERSIVTALTREAKQVRCPRKTTG